MDNILKTGDKVKWTYKHYLNRKTFVKITKTGIIVGIHKNKSGVYKVKFDGNKNPVFKDNFALRKDEPKCQN